jgi:hypothetical protein
MRTRRSKPIHRPARERGAQGRGPRLRRRFALAALVSAALGLIGALGALAADTNALDIVGITSGPSSPARPGSAAGHTATAGSSARPAPAAGRAPASGPGPPQAWVTLDSAGTPTAVPRSFLGISTEYWALPSFERQMSLLERTLSLLQVPGEGPLLLRIGGDSADHSFWVPKARPMPPWAFELTPAWLQRTADLVRTLGLQVIIDLNLVTDSPRIAAQWAQAAMSQLPLGSIDSFEIGNEPDIYNRLYWMTTVSHSKVVPPLGLTAGSYARSFQAYARALRHVAPGVPLVGPALANPGLSRDWISSLIASRPVHPAAITLHRYPYSACSLPGTSTFATIPRVLSEHATAAMARTVTPAVATARRAGIPVRVTELNSVTCGGRRGVSDTFATALWAPDALFELLRTGVAGVNVHVRARAINAAFTLDRDRLGANPLLYGLITFARTLGPGAQLVPLRLQAKPSIHLKAWGVRVEGGYFHVLLIDKGQRPVVVALRLPATGAATVERLTAPGPGAKSGVTFNGQYLAADATWSGSGSAQRIYPGAYGYTVAVPRYSAALVTVHLRHGGLTVTPVATSPTRARNRHRAVHHSPVPLGRPRQRGGRYPRARPARHRG